MTDGSGPGDARGLISHLQRTRVPSKDVYMSTLSHAAMRELWPITTKETNLPLLKQFYGTDAEDFEYFDRIIAGEIGDPHKVHFTVRGVKNGRPRGWGRIDLTGSTRPLRCAVFFPNDAAEMTIQVIYLIMQSAFDCEGYTEVELHTSKLTISSDHEHEVYGFGLVNVLRNQHLDRTRNSISDVYVATIQQWRVLKKCIEAWLSSLDSSDV